VRILVLGGDGMLGHKLLLHFSARHDIRVTLRRGLEDYAEYGLFHQGNAYPDVDVRSNQRLIEVLSDFRPEVVINAVGVVKQRAAAKLAIPSIEINALLPHRLALLTRAIDAKLVHISTDCVFSGRMGGYTEASASDAEDLYGKSKFLGEVSDEGCITLRTSIIGRELSRKTGLLEWFLAQHEPIRGYTKAIYSGLTTQELARVIERLLTEFPRAHGLYHVSSEPISKYDLLMVIRDALAIKIDIVADAEFYCDRRLVSDRFRREFSYLPPTWRAMVDELAQEIKGTSNDL
jgi:dTDP-4-dehydrorhamnose reductase